MRRRLLWGLLGSLVAVGCPDTTVDRPLVPPEVTIVAPDDTEGPVEVFYEDVVEFVASVSDSYDAPADIAVTWDTSYLDSDNQQQTASLGSSEVGDDGRTSLLVSDLAVGSHTVRCTATDTDGGSSSDFVNIEVALLDEVPTVEIVSPSDGDSFDEGDDIELLAVADDDGDVTLLEIAWHSNIDGYLGGSPPAPNGVASLLTSELTPGEQEVTVWATDAGGESGQDTVAFTIVPFNQPPTDPVVYITPAGPSTDDDLVCVAQGSTDPEGGAVTYTYTWDEDGFPTGWSGTTLPHEQTEQGEVWDCRVTAYDDENLGSNEVTATVMIGNSLPAYSSVTLTPSPAYETSTLTCTPYGWSDPDGDPEGAAFEWLVNGSLVAAAATDQLDGADFDHFDDVECKVYPDDGFSLGNPLLSPPVPVLNTLPDAPQLELQPSPPHVDTDLVCALLTPTADPDPDTLTHEYEWYADGVLQPSLTGDTVPAAQLQLGETWTCRARAFDGYDHGPWSEVSGEVRPYGGDVVITEVMIDPSTVDDAVGEYIEVYNASADVILLDGWTISDGATDLHVINSGGAALFYPGEYLVLGVNANVATNGGVPVDYQYNGVTLEEDFDAIILSFDGDVVDDVAYDWGVTFPSPSGASMILEPTIFDAVANDDGANWCASTVPLAVGADFGSPGTINDDCTCSHSDDDGDGYGDDPACPPDLIDCDDTNPLSFPGNVEVCDGYDNDCNGVIDDGFDMDGDGYALCFGDCDDTEPAAYPNNPEVCDGIDNDCNGAVDDGTPPVPGCQTYYADVDGDGWGQAGNFQCLCAPDGDYTTQVSGDCDDADAGINPWALEVCDDVDNNCDGAVDEAWPDCIADHAVTGCGQGQCFIDYCDTFYYDMNLDYGDGCEALEDEYEIDGGDSCLSPIANFNTLTDTPSSILNIVGNVVPQYDEDWYLINADDLADVDGTCDPFDVEVFFSNNPDDRFRFEVYNTQCSLYATTLPDGTVNSCGNNLVEFNWDASGECPCVNGTPGPGQQQCTDNSLDLLIRVYQISGPDDDTTYTLTVTNG